MPMEFSVLGSGSAGNSAVIKAGSSSLLIDIGLGPRVCLARLETINLSWESIGAVLLTHTHGDHVTSAGLKWLSWREIPLWCHPGHEQVLEALPGYRAMREKNFVRFYDERPFIVNGGVRVEPIELSHDGGPTFGFRLEGQSLRRERPVAIGYVADTGCFCESIADALSDVDTLGLEFNHDVQLQRSSGRHAALIARNLGDRGHLSNDQGAELLTEVVRRSRKGSVRELVLLHLSRDCNRPELAASAASAALAESEWQAKVHVASQQVPLAVLKVGPAHRPTRSVKTTRVAASSAPLFPWESSFDKG